MGGLVSRFHNDAYTLGSQVSLVDDACPDTRFFNASLPIAASGNAHAGGLMRNLSRNTSCKCADATERASPCSLRTDSDSNAGAALDRTYNERFLQLEDANCSTAAALEAFTPIIESLRSEQMQHSFRLDRIERKLSSH